MAAAKKTIKKKTSPSPIADAADAIIVAKKKVTAEPIAESLRPMDSIGPAKPNSARQIAMRRGADGVISSLYKHSDGEDMGKLQPRVKHRTRWFVLALSLLVLLAGASAAGFVVFNQQSKFAERIDFTVTGPTGIASGEEVEMLITISNNERAPLRNATVALQSPLSFSFQKSDPASSDGQGISWELGSIAAGSKKRIKITGRIIGNVGSASEFQAQLNYKPGNFNYDFTKVVTASIPISSSQIQVEVAGPTKAVKDQAVQYVLTYRNTSPEDLQDVHVRVVYPSGFVANKFVPKPTLDIGTTEWIIDKLDKGVEGTITIEGVMGGNAGDLQDFSAQIGVLSADNAFQLQAEEHVITSIIAPQFTLQLSFNGSDKSGIVHWDDQISGKLIYKNTGDSVLKNLVLLLPLSSDIFDAAGFSSPQKAVADKDGVRWSYADLTDLAQMDPGEQGELTFTLATKKTSAGKNAKKQLQTELQAKVSEGHADDVDASAVQSVSNSVALKVSTTLSVTTEARYYDAAGTAVGSGAFPPRAGRDSTFRIYWTIKNTSNDVRQLQLSTTLPQGVLWQNATSVNAGEKLVFVPDTRKVVWMIDKVPAYTGSDFPQLSAWFDVTVHPQAEDVGKFLLLSDQTVWSGQDVFTAEDLGGSQDTLSTKLESDTMAAGRGQVVAE